MQEDEKYKCTTQSQCRQLLEVGLLTRSYIVVDTKFTRHHLEVTTYKDRGRFKWIAEMKAGWAAAVSSGDEEARRSHIDWGDLFPRLYFIKESLIAELLAWIDARDLTLESVYAPNLYKDGA